MRLGSSRNYLPSSSAQHSNRCANQRHAGSDTGVRALEIKRRNQEFTGGFVSVLMVGSCC